MEAPFKTSDDVLNLGTLPEECVVLGGGIVACELAQFLARVGVGLPSCKEVVRF